MLRGYRYNSSENEIPTGVKPANEQINQKPPPAETSRLKEFLQLAIVWAYPFKKLVQFRVFIPGFFILFIQFLQPFPDFLYPIQILQNALLPSAICIELGGGFVAWGLVVTLIM